MRRYFIPTVLLFSSAQDAMRYNRQIGVETTKHTVSHSDIHFGLIPGGGASILIIRLSSFIRRFPCSFQSLFIPPSSVLHVIEPDIGQLQHQCNRFCYYDHSKFSQSPIMTRLQKKVIMHDYSRLHLFS